MIAKGADVNTKDKYFGWPPLDTTSSNNHKNTVQALVAKGASVDTKNNDGWTPLHSVEALIAKGAYVNTKNDYGLMPLQFASHNGHTNVSDWSADCQRCWYQCQK